VRDQANALVSSITSAISQPVLLGFIGSTSCINRHIADRAWTLGRQAHKQYAGITRQPGQRSAREPRLTKGLMARARRWVRRRETAWLIGCAARKGKSTLRELEKGLKWPQFTRATRTSQQYAWLYWPGLTYNCAPLNAQPSGWSMHQ